MTTHSSALVTNNLRLLNERVRELDVTFRSARTTEPNDLINQIWLRIELFDKAIGESLRCLESATVEQFERDSNNTLAFLSKRLRRAKVAHKEIEKFAKAFCHDATVCPVTFIQSEALDPWFKDVEETLSFRSLERDSVNYLYQAQIPAIVSAQACVYHALLATIAHELLHMRKLAKEQKASADRPAAVIS